MVFQIRGAPLFDILTPLSRGGESPALAGAVGAEINGGFVSLSRAGVCVLGPARGWAGKGKSSETSVGGQGRERWRGEEAR